MWRVWVEWSLIVSCWWFPLHKRFIRPQLMLAAQWEGKRRSVRTCPAASLAAVGSVEHGLCGAWQPLAWWHSSAAAWQMSIRRTVASKWNCVPSLIAVTRRPDYCKMNYFNHNVESRKHGQLAYLERDQGGARVYMISDVAYIVKTQKCWVFCHTSDFSIVLRPTSFCLIYCVYRYWSIKMFVPVI